MRRPGEAGGRVDTARATTTMPKLGGPGRSVPGRRGGGKAARSIRVRQLIPRHPLHRSVHRPRQLPPHAAPSRCRGRLLARCSAHRYRPPKPAQLYIPASPLPAWAALGAPPHLRVHTPLLSRRRIGISARQPRPPSPPSPRQRVQMPRSASTHLWALMWRAAMPNGPVLRHRSIPVPGIRSRSTVGHPSADGWSGGSRSALG